MIFCSGFIAAYIFNIIFQLGRNEVASPPSVCALLELRTPNDRQRDD